MAVTEAAPRARRLRLPTPAPRLQALNPHDTEPMERQVYRTIRRSLMAGAVLPGAKLTSRSLAGALGVSAMPVREALKRLESDGIVESRAQSAFYVRDLTRKEFREVLEVRLRLEGLATRTAAACFTSADLKVARQLDAEISDSRHSSELLDANLRFHFFIYQLADQPYNLSLIENTWLRIGPALNIVLKNIPAQASYETHGRLLEALAAQDPDRAERALHEDLLDAASVIEAALEAR